MSAGRHRTILDCLNQRFAEYGCRLKTLDASVREQLLRYRWPGNIRELQNVFEAMFALSDPGDCIDSTLLPIAALPGTSGDGRTGEPAAADITAGWRMGEAAIDTASCARTTYPWQRVIWASRATPCT